MTSCAEKKELHYDVMTQTPQPVVSQNIDGKKGEGKVEEKGDEEGEKKEKKTPGKNGKREK